MSIITPPTTLVLRGGAHVEPDDPATAQDWCVMEAAAWVAGEPWSDHPDCVCPVIGAFMRSWNDGLPDDDARTEHLARYLAPAPEGVIGTKATADVEQRRAWMATDWLIRVQAPAWLRVADLAEHADALAGLPEVDSTNVAEAQPLLEAARTEARAVGAAAWDAAGAAARAAAWDAAGAAARAAARAAAGAAARAAAWDAVGAAAWDAVGAAARAAAGAAARAAAWDAARDTAWDAAWDAAGAAVASTVETLQASAHDLLARMIRA